MTCGGGATHLFHFGQKICCMSFIFLFPVREEGGGRREEEGGGRREEGGGRREGGRRREGGGRREEGGGDGVRGWSE